MSASLEEHDLDDDEAPIGGEDSESQQISKDASNGTRSYLKHCDVGLIEENVNSDGAKDKLHNVPQQIAATTATIHWIVFKSNAGIFGAETPVGSSSREIRREGTLCRYLEGWLTNERYFRADHAPQGNCDYFDVKRQSWDKIPFSRPGNPFSRAGNRAACLMPPRVLTSSLDLGGILLYWLLGVTVTMTSKMPMQPTGKQVMCKASYFNHWDPSSHPLLLLSHTVICPIISNRRSN